MSLSFVSQTVSVALTLNSIEDEVSSLLDVARNEIGLFEAMDEFLANELANLPVLIEGNVVIKFEDSRGFVNYVAKNLSDCLWVSAMKQLQYHGAVNYQLLQAAFTNWINDNVYTEHDDLGRKTYTRVTTTDAEMLELAKSTLDTMQSQNIVERNISKQVIRLQAGNNITAKVCLITQELKDTLNESISTLRSNASMKCAPLMHKPLDWTDAMTGVAPDANMKLVKGGSYKVKTKRVALKVLEAVNKLQSVKFTVATCILEAAKDMNIKQAMYKSAEFKSMFSDKELNKEGFDVYNEIETLANKEFYFPVTCDKRGRMYYRGGLLSPQGVDFCKAAFQFADFKPLGKNGHQALAIHTANVCGQDKISIKRRMAWVKENWSAIMTINTHMDIREQFKGADTFQALVACKELQRLNTIDEAWSEKTSNLVCHQDGTCNGLQHMAAITGDRPTAEAVNCTASNHNDEPADIYGIIAVEALQHCEDDSVRMLILKYGRDMAKNPVMITGYGATESTIIRNTAKFLSQKGEDPTKAQGVGEAYLAAIEAKAGAVTQLTDAIATRMKYALVNGKKKFTWATADGFLASTMYEEDEDTIVRVGTFHIRKRGMGKSPVDMRKSAQAMSPNFVHSIDSTHLRMVVNACEHELVAVHDSIGSHPCDYFETADMIRQKFYLVHTGYDALADLCDSIEQEVPQFSKDNDYNPREALKSAYIFS